MSRTLALICSIKDEAPYIIDWVAHHRALGFTDITIFQNESVDGSDRLCRALETAGYIYYVGNSDPKEAPPRFRDLPAQRRAYGWALRLPQVQEANYLFVADIDEYLELPKDEDFNAMLDRLRDPDVVSFAWRMMGSNGQTEFSAKPVTERFVKAAAPRNAGTVRPFNQYKSAYPPKSTRLYNLHRPRKPHSEKLNWVAPSGRNIQKEAQRGNTIANFPYTYANLRHYHVKSRAEYMVKMVRGFASHDVNQFPQIGLPLFDCMDANDVNLPFKTAAYQHGRELADEMRTNPSINAIEQDCLEQFEKLVQRSKQAIEQLDIFGKSNYIKVDFKEYFRKEVYDHL